MLSSGVSAHLAASNKNLRSNKNGDKVSSQCYYWVRRRETMHFPNPFFFPWKTSNSSNRVCRSLHCEGCCIGQNALKISGISFVWYHEAIKIWQTMGLFIACIYKAVVSKETFGNLTRLNFLVNFKKSSFILKEKWIMFNPVPF